MLKVLETKDGQVLIVEDSKVTATTDANMVAHVNRLNWHLNRHPKDAPARQRLQELNSQMHIDSSNQ